MHHYILPNSWDWGFQVLQNGQRQTQTILLVCPLTFLPSYCRFSIFLLFNPTKHRKEPSTYQKYLDDLFSIHYARLKNYPFPTIWKNVTMITMQKYDLTGKRRRKRRLIFRPIPPKLQTTEPDVITISF